MAKYSKKAQQTVASAMRKMKKGKLTSGQSGKKVTNPKQAVAIGLSEAREKGAKVPAPKKKAAPKKAAKKTVTKKSAVKKAAPKKKAAAKKTAKKTAPKKATKKAAVKKTATKKKAAAKKTTVKKAAPAKKTAVKKTAKKAAPKKTAGKTASKKSAQQAVAMDKLIVSQPLEMNQPPVATPVDTLLSNEHHEHTVDPNDIPVSDFSKFTAKADPRQNIKASSKPKGGIKPSGKKPLWN